MHSPVVVPSGLDSRYGQSPERWTRCRAEICQAASVSRPINILVLGPIGAGKSSVINTILSAFLVDDRARPCKDAKAFGGEGGHVTQAVQEYPLQGSHVRLIDSWGYTDENYKHGEFEKLLAGHMGPGFSQGQSLTAGVAGYRTHPKMKERIHAVIAVLDGQAVQGSERFAVRYKSFAESLLKQDYRFVIVATKMDLLDPKLIQATPTQIMGSEQATQLYHRICQYASVQPNEIFPCKPYLNEYERNKAVETIPLMALAQAVEHGKLFYKSHAKELAEDEAAEHAQQRQHEKWWKDYQKRQAKETLEKTVAVRNARIVQALKYGFLVLLLAFIVGFYVRR